MKPLLASLSLAAVLLSAGGCALLSPAPAVKLDNSARLMSRPDFAAARAAAPDWCL